MTTPIPPAWRPLLALASPILAPLLIRWHACFGRDRRLAQEMNRRRLEEAAPGAPIGP